MTSSDVVTQPSVGAVSFAAMHGADLASLPLWINRCVDLPCSSEHHQNGVGVQKGKGKSVRDRWSKGIQPGDLAAPVTWS